MKTSFVIRYFYETLIVSRSPCVPAGRGRICFRGHETESCEFFTATIAKILSSLKTYSVEFVSISSHFFQIWKWSDRSMWMAICGSHPSKMQPLNTIGCAGTTPTTISATGRFHWMTPNRFVHRVVLRRSFQTYRRPVRLKNGSKSKWPNGAPSTV